VHRLDEELQAAPNLAAVEAIIDNETAERTPKLVAPKPESTPPQWVVDLKQKSMKYFN